MNNKGQTLVLFIALLPFIFVLLVLVFDLSYISIEKNKIEGIAKSSINSLNKNKSYEEVKKIIKENDKNIKTSFNNKTLCLEKKEDVIFGSIIGKENYNIKICKNLNE